MKLKRSNKPKGQLAAKKSGRPLSSDRPAFEERLREALALHRSGMLSQAMQRYSLLLDENPRCADALHLLGVACHQQGDFSRALNVITQAINLNPEAPAFHSNQGNTLKEMGLLAAARESYDRALSKDPSYTDAIYNSGVVLQELGQPRVAIEWYQRALELDPTLAAAYFNMGNAHLGFRELDDALRSYDAAIACRADWADVYLRRGWALRALERPNDAVTNYQRAIESCPPSAELHYQLANVFSEIGDCQQAVAHYKIAIEIEPGFAEAHCHCAYIYQRQGNHGDAIAGYEAAIALRPDYADAHSNCAASLYALRRLQDAIASYDMALSFRPDLAEAHCGKGDALRALGLLNGAVSCYTKAISLKPEFAAAHSNLGAALQELRRYVEAFACYDKAIALKPDLVEAYSNRAAALQETGQFPQAVNSCDRAIEIDPYYAKAHSNRGISLLCLKDLQGARASLERALAIRPDFPEANLNKALLLLTTGDWEEGFRQYEWRWKAGTAAGQSRAFSAPLWLGIGSLRGKTILLHAEQGLGDTIQFSRYAHKLVELGSRVILEIQRPLTGLFESFSPACILVAQGDPLPQYDFHCPLMSLPLAFKTTPQSIPEMGPYLQPAAERGDFWRTRLSSSRFKIGIAWQGNALNRNDAVRSFPIANFKEISRLASVELVCLQKNAGLEQLVGLDPDFKLTYLGEDIDASGAFLDTAAVMMHMDLIITSDTAVAHLAGALGRKVWLALNLVPDWRWLLEGEATGWYPSMRLYRQAERGNWDELFLRIEADVRKLLQDPTHRVYPDEMAKPAHDFSSRMRRATSLHQSGDLVEAKKIYAELMSENPMDPAPPHALGLIAYQSGDFRIAVDLIDIALKIEPSVAWYWSNHGAALVGLKDFESAVSSFEKALALDPMATDAHSNRGNALQALGQFDAALASYDRALFLKPDFANAWSNRGAVLEKMGKLESAIASCSKALEIDAGIQGAYLNRGTVYLKLEDYDSAIRDFDRVVAMNPSGHLGYLNRGAALQGMLRFSEAIASYHDAIRMDNHCAEAYSNLGNALCAIGDFEAALTACDKAISLNSGFAEAHTNRGNALKGLKELGAAIGCYDRSIEIRPEFLVAYSNRAVVLQEQGHYHEARISCEKALAIDPCHVESHFNLANALQELGRLEAAKSAFDKAILIRPNYAEARFNRSLILLLMGDFKEGFAEYEWRWMSTQFTSPKRGFSQPQWSGTESLRGRTILIHAEQGLGDTIQFCRYIKTVATLGARVLFEVQRPLRGLLEPLSGFCQLLSVGDALPDFDYHCPLLTLPLALGTELANIPGQTPYLRAVPELIGRWKNYLADKSFKIGICWQGNAAGRVDVGRSFPLSMLETIGKVAGVRLFSLQKGGGAEQLGELSETLQVVDFGQDLDTTGAFLDTAAIMENMDLVITSDTAVAHLAGALGCRVWVALKLFPDWRWMLSGSACPWYPSMRLFRQSAKDDWLSVFEDMRAELLHVVT